VLETVTTNAHPYRDQLIALFLAVAPVVLIFVLIIAAAWTWRYRTRKRHGPPPKDEIGNLDTSVIETKEEEPRH
jgi:heme/copper-type cytochrome/quinol oxidase subunit 2